MLNAHLHTLIIAQIMGLYLLIMSITMIARGDYYRKLIDKFLPDGSSIYAVASLWLAIGLLLVVIHNVWIWGFESVISALCWLVLIKAVLWLAFPHKMTEVVKRVYGGSGYYILAVIGLILSVLLLAFGFYSFR